MADKTRRDFLALMPEMEDTIGGLLILIDAEPAAETLRPSRPLPGPDERAREPDGEDEAERRGGEDDLDGAVGVKHESPSVPEITC